MAESNTWVSVVICAYNAEKYIEKAIESVLNQTYRNLELVVVDDASLDSTPEIVRVIKERDTRLKLFERQENGGLAKARMTGLEKSNYSLLMYLDADDIALPEMLDKQVSKLESDPLIMGVATYAHYIAEDELKILGTQKVGPTTREQYYDLYRNNKLVFLPATTLCRKRLVIEAGAFRTEGFSNHENVRYQDYCDDLDLWCRMSDLSEDGWFFITVPVPLFLYRKNINSISGKNVFAMQGKMRWIKSNLRRRRSNLAEKEYDEFLQDIANLERINNLRLDYAALIYKKMAFCIVGHQYLWVPPLLLAVCILDPKYVMQKIKSQSIRIKR